MRPSQFGRRSLALVALLAVPVMAATSADMVRNRTTNYKQLGAAFKAVNDALRAGRPVALLSQPAAQIVAASRAQYSWFPVGSGPRPGLRTAAKLEIWSDRAGFRSRQNAFAQQAASFQRAVAAGNADVVRAEFRKLGGACKGCHDQFREQSD